VIGFIENREPEVAAALPVGCDGKPRQEHSAVSSTTPNASGRFFGISAVAGTFSQSEGSQNPLGDAWAGES
jgi:hypothetical protein